MIKKLILAIILFALHGVISVNAQNVLKVKDAKGLIGNEIEIEVEINNVDDFTAFQFDLLLPALFTYKVNTLALTDRKDDHIVTHSLLNDGTRLRIIAFSFNNFIFDGNSGAVVKFTLNTPATPGSYNLAFDVSAAYEILNTSGVNICSGTENGTVTLCNELLATVNFNNVTCFGENNGSISITDPNGGTSNYEYSIDGGTNWQLSGTFFNLEPFTYDVRIRDVAYPACVSILNGVLEISEPATALSATISETNKVTCKGGSDGSAKVVAADGWSASYTYLWNDLAAQTTDEATGLTAGNYSVTVTDAEGCTVVKDITVTEPATALTGIASETNKVSCNGGSDGEATMTANGGWGTNTYSIDGSNYVASNLFTGLITGYYTLYVKDVEGCIFSDGVEITNLAPVITGLGGVPPTVNVSGGESYVYETTRYDNYSYEWIVVNGTAVVNSYPYDWQAEITWNDNATTGSVTVKANTYPTPTGCFRISEVLNINIAPIGLKGYITYKNISNTPMDNVTVNMLDNTGVVLASAITNSNGYYEITSMPAGVVTHVEVSTDKTWGGGNSTDALAIQRRTVNFPVTFWNPVAFIDNVASVRNTGIVNSTDALFVRHRAIQLITGFPAGDWAFWASDYGVNFSKLSPVVTNKARIAISEVHTNTLNIQALCYGDVNGSYTPGNGKSSMVLQSNEVTRVIPNTAFELPLIPENEMDFSALTLFVQYASQKLNILEVKSNIPGIEYSIVDGWVNVAWSNLKPVHINAGEALITFVIATTEPVSENDELFNLGGATEFANEYSEVLSNYKLSINRIDNSMNSALHCYPNPFNEELNISYVLAEPGNVRISIVNSMGAVVSQIVNRYHDAGAYSIPLDPEFYGINNRGMYFIRIEAQGERTVFNKLFKVMYAY